MTSSDGGLRVVVTGATGNIGTSVVRALSEDPAIASITGVAQRTAELSYPKFDLVTADVAEDELDQVFAGADAVVHLAWLFQPTHDPVITWRANVLGGIRVFEAAARARVPALIYSSSVGAYSPAEHKRPVDESWPTHGWPDAAYTREKSYLERYLDAFEPRNPDLRVVRMRPAFVFKRESASQQRRLFAGPFLPGSLVRPGLVPLLPDVPGLTLQAVHSFDLADAFRRAVLRPVRGAFNVAADPVIDPGVLAGLLHARTIPVPAFAVRAGTALAWRLRVIPASPGLLDAVLRLPVMDSGRARDELGWTPRHTATEAIGEFLSGLRAGAGMATEPLAPGHQAREIRTGVGERP